MPHTILLVEDNEADVKLFRIALRELKFDVDLKSVSNGEAAWAYLNRRGEHPEAPRPHLIFLDLNLPRIDGRQLLKMMRESEEFRCIPVVIFTTSQAQRDIRKCYEMGCNLYLLKPVELERLYERVGATLNFMFKIARIPDPLATQAKGA